MITINELKEHIKKTETELRESKKILRQDHREVPNSWSLQSELHYEKQKARLLYRLYAFLRGKTLTNMEKEPIPRYLWINSDIRNLLETDENVELFSNWCKNT